MKDIKLYALGLPTLLLLGGLLIFSSDNHQDNQQENSKHPTSTPVLVETLPHTEAPSRDVLEAPISDEDFSIEITDLDEESRLHFLIHNHSQEELYYSMHFSLSKWEKETWVPVELHMAFIEVACILPSGLSTEELIYLSDLEEPLTSGTYRLEKIFSGETYYDTFTID